MPSRAPARAPLVALVLAATLPALGKAGAIGDSDTWWHLRTGELILHTHRVPHRDPYSWTAHGAAWHANAWLSDVVFALVRRAGGLSAISFMRAGFVVAFAVVLFRYARECGATAWPAAAGSAVATTVVFPFMTERPQLLSFVLFPTVIMLARRALAGSNIAVVLTGVVIALWSNLHGVYVTGVAIVAVIATAQAWQQRRVGRALLVIAVAVVAGLANPFGVGGYSYAMHVRSVSGPIQEWRHFHVGDPRDQAIGALALLGALAMVRTGHWRRADIVLPFLVLVASVADAIRNGPLLVIVATGELAAGMRALRVPRLRAAIRPRRAPILLGLFVAWVALAVSALPTVRDAGRIDTNVFPVRAVRAIPKGCRLLNEYDLGGFVIDRRWPSVRVSQDGRNDLYGLRGENRIDAQALVLHARQHPRTWLDRHHVHCVLAHPRRPLARLLARDSAWRTAISERAGMLFIRRPTP